LVSAESSDEKIFKDSDGSFNSTNLTHVGFNQLYVDLLIFCMHFLIALELSLSKTWSLDFKLEQFKHEKKLKQAEITMNFFRT